MGALNSGENAPIGDLDLMLGAGHAVGVPLQLAAQREIYGSLIAQGEGETDFIATVPHLERR
jgi:3-hydroxyisobutyrate dehydrogenase-like beta-hydroxyacid dehydrogenase